MNLKILNFQKKLRIEFSKKERGFNVDLWLISI